MGPCFDKVKYKSSATQGRDAVDVVRFMKMLYMMTCPDGEFHPDRSHATPLAFAFPPYPVFAVRTPLAHQKMNSHIRKEMWHTIRYQNPFDKVRCARRQVQCTKKEGVPDDHLDSKT